MPTQNTLPEVRTVPVLYDRCLGIKLSGGEVGLALATVTRVIHHAVLNLRKKRSREGKEARFRQVIELLLARHVPGRIVIVASFGVSGQSELLTAFAVWLSDFAQVRRLRLSTVTPDAVRRAVVGGTRPSTRELARMLCERFEAVRHRSPDREPVPGADRVPELVSRGRRLRTSRERYWASMFLALGAAVCDLEREDGL